MPAVAVDRTRVVLQAAQDQFHGRGSVLGQGGGGQGRVHRAAGGLGEFGQPLGDQARIESALGRLDQQGGPSLGLLSGIPGVGDGQTPPSDGIGPPQPGAVRGGAVGANLNISVQATRGERESDVA